MEKIGSGYSKKIEKVNNVCIKCEHVKEKRLKMPFFVLLDICFEMFVFVLKWGKI